MELNSEHVLRRTTISEYKTFFGAFLFVAFVTFIYLNISGSRVEILEAGVTVSRIIRKSNESRHKFAIPVPNSLRNPFLMTANGSLDGSALNETKKVLPKCHIFLQELKTDLAKWQFLSHYDPGNCIDVTDLNALVNRTKGSKIDEVRNLPGKYSNELWEKCQALKPNQSSDRPWRLCQTLPSPFFFFLWQVQRYEYDEALHYKPMKEVGEGCFNRPLAVYFDPTGGNHPGGPRKVVNAFLSGMRLIQKPYAYMAWNISAYDFKYQSCPYNKGLLYNLSNEEAEGWFLGPTVIHSQFVNRRFTAGTKERVHITASSVAALNTDQYFPHLQLNKSAAVVLPTGVDTETFKPKVPYQEKNKVFMSYRKRGCQTKFLTVLEASAKFAGYQIRTINYGSYNEETFKSTLEESKFTIFCDGTETQGLAGEEILAMDVPMFVINKNSVPYFSDDCGHILKDTNADNLKLEFEEFLRKIEKGSYSPRKWIVDHLSYWKAAINYLRTMCGKPTEWWPPKGN